MKLTIKLECPERLISRSLEVELPTGGSKMLFNSLMEVVEDYETMFPCMKNTDRINSGLRFCFCSECDKLNISGETK